MMTMVCCCTLSHALPPFHPTHTYRQYRRVLQSRCCTYCFAFCALLLLSLLASLNPPSFVGECDSPPERNLEE